MEKKTLYKPFKYKGNGFFKYSVYVKNEKTGKPKLIHFGDRRYEQFKDKIGLYKNLDHNDPKRRERYLARAKGIRNKEGELTWKDKNTKNYWAVRILW